MANIIQTFPKENGTDLSIIAEEFDDTKDYKVGDKVIKDKKYYVFTSDHNAGAWDSSDVDETNVSEEIPIGLTDEDMDEIKAQFHPVGYGNVRNYQIYSPTEHVVGEWQEYIDDVLKKKTVYEKRLIFDSLTFLGKIKSSWTSIADVSTLNIDKLVNVVSGTQKSDNSVRNAQDLLYKVSNGDLVYFAEYAHEYSAIDELTIQYTKTTDSWEEV